MRRRASRTLLLLSVTAMVATACLKRCEGDKKSAREYFIKALRYDMEMKKPEDSEKHLRQLIASNPNIADAQNLLGIIRLEAGDLTEALARFDAAVLLVPDHPDYHFNRGVAYAKAGRLDEAKDEFRSYLSTHPDNAACRHNLDVLLKGE